MCSRLRHDFIPQHIYGYAFVVKSLQLHVSPRFSAPRYDTYCKIWVKQAEFDKIPFISFALSVQGLYSDFRPSSIPR